MLAGVSTRRFRRTREPVGEDGRAPARVDVEVGGRRASSSSAPASTLGELMSRRLDDVRLAVMMLDGIELQGRTLRRRARDHDRRASRSRSGCGKARPRTRPSRRALLADLVDRGLDLEQGVLFVIDGAKALAQGDPRRVRRRAPVQRCIRHKERNVLDHLPERDRPAVKQRLRARVGARRPRARARRSCARSPASSTARTPAPPARCAKGMEETLTLTRLGITRPARSARSSSTNPCESMIEIVRRTQRNVKRWQSGDMALRWTAAGMLEAEQQFRKIIGYRDLAKLAIAIERDLRRHRSTDAAHTPTEEAATLVTA